MDALLDEFDDLELQSTQPRDDDPKGKRPVVDEDTESEAEDDAPEDAAFAPSSPTKSSEPGELTCAICLHEIPLQDMAMIKGCDHIYCACCILHWSLHKEDPWCPQCKRSFTSLLTYRSLDGELNDFPMEESVVLLKRARWFEDFVRGSSRHGALLLEDSCAAEDTAWQEYAEDYDLAEDEHIEDFYFSSAAGRARVLLGNRRFGEGGFIAGGRRQARPMPAERRKSGGGGGGGKGARKNAAASKNVGAGAGPSSSASGLVSGGATRRGGGASRAIPTPNANGGRKAMAMQRDRSSPGMYSPSPQPCGGEWGSVGSAGVLGSSPCGCGRRAKRNARRAAEDAAAAGQGAERASSSPSEAGAPVAV